MNTAINRYLTPALLVLSLALSALAQADTHACEPQDLQGPYNRDPAFSDHGALLRMQYLTPAQGSHKLAVSGWARGDWATSDELQSRSEAESAPRLPPSSSACPPGLVPPQGQSPQPRQAPARVWL